MENQLELIRPPHFLSLHIQYKFAFFGLFPVPSKKTHTLAQKSGLDNQNRWHVCFLGSIIDFVTLLFFTLLRQHLPCFECTFRNVSLSMVSKGRQEWVTYACECFLCMWEGESRMTERRVKESCDTSNIFDILPTARAKYLSVMNCIKVIWLYNFQPQCQVEPYNTEVMI